MVAPHPLLVSPAAAGQRLDRFLAQALPALSRARLQALIEAGDVTVDGGPARASQRVRSGQQVSVAVPEPVAAVPLPEDIPIDVIHEDAHLLVIDKPAGLVVHPGAGTLSGTLVNALLHRVHDLSGVGGVLRPGIVHRLDRGTSGLMVVAKDDATHRALAAQFASRSVEKEYVALVLGVPGRESGRIEAAIGRDPVHRKRMSVTAPRGRAARSDWRVVKPYAGAALLRVRIHTGRTHQIRVHLASVGHPIAGDPTYGGGRQARCPTSLRVILDALDRPALHSALLAFRHPGTGQDLRLESPVPADIRTVLQALAKLSPP